MAEVISADQEQIAFWWSFPQAPETPAEERVIDLIFKKFYVNGRFIAPEFRKKTALNPSR